MARVWQATAFTDTDELVALAPIIEATGFAGVTIPDHVFVPEQLESAYPYTEGGKPYWSGRTDWPDPWVLTGAMAAVTTSLRFATFVYVLPARSPFLVAKAVGTAAVLSGNRVALGAGAGWMREEFEQLGQQFEARGRRMEEMMEVLRLLWAGGMVEHHGEFYDFGRLQMSPAPTAPVPIWLGGSSPAALRRMARLADGWAAPNCPVDELLPLLDQLRKLRAEAGRAEQPFTVMAALETPDVDLALRLLDAGVTDLTTSAWLTYGARHDDVDGKRRALERFADEVLGALP
jgi:probable F420-dependent oxidoreductase